MSSRIRYKVAAPGAYHALLGIEEYLGSCGLEPVLLDLVRLRVSQINGCAFCIDMHAKDLRARGESEERLYLLNAWREAPLYSERERAALAWAEEVTRLPNGEVSDAVYAQALEQFSPPELTNLTLAVTAINSWNRVNISFRVAPGAYRPAANVR